MVSAPCDWWSTAEVGPHGTKGRHPHPQAGRDKPSQITVQRYGCQPMGGSEHGQDRAWNGFIAPAGTPKEIIDKLSADIISVLKMSDVKDRLGTDGSIVMGSSPAEFARFIESETVKWGQVIRASGASAE